MNYYLSMHIVDKNPDYGMEQLDPGEGDNSGCSLIGDEKTVV